MVAAPLSSLDMITSVTLARTVDIAISHPSPQIFGPGGQDLLNDDNGVILVYRGYSTLMNVSRTSILNILFPADYYNASGSFVSA